MRLFLPLLFIFMLMLSLVAICGLSGYTLYEQTRPLPPVIQPVEPTLFDQNLSRILRLDARIGSLPPDDVGIPALRSEREALRVEACASLSGAERTAVQSGICPQ
jgi:hypothetical protein